MNTFMPTNLINKLKQNHLTIVAQLKDEQIYQSQLRGIAPVLNQLQKNELFFKDAIIVDKVVGKAAAMLFIKANVKHIYALTMSKKAIAVLDKYNMKYTYDSICDYVENRSHTGMCPMEQSVEHIDDIEEAYLALIKKVKELSGGSR